MEEYNIFKGKLKDIVNKLNRKSIYYIEIIYNNAKIENERVDIYYYGKYVFSYYLSTLFKKYQEELLTEEYFKRKIYNGIQRRVGNKNV